MVLGFFSAGNRSIIYRLTRKNNIQQKTYIPLFIGNIKVFNFY